MGVPILLYQIQKIGDLVKVQVVNIKVRNLKNFVFQFPDFFKCDCRSVPIPCQAALISQHADVASIVFEIVKMQRNLLSS